MESTAKKFPADHFRDGSLPGRRSHALNSSSSSTHFTSATAASSPSQYRHFAVPFSWELRPGFPRSPKATTAAAAGGGKLPLPPLFRSHAYPSSRYSRHRSHGRLGLSADDPFTVALQNCAKGLSLNGAAGEEMIDAWEKAANAQQRRGEIAGRFGLGRSRFYGSCKDASSVATAKAIVRRFRRAGSDRGPLELVGINLSRASVIPGPS